MPSRRSETQPTTKTRRRRVRDELTGLPPLNLNAAGIDVGERAHYVAIPAGRAAVNVRQFGSFTNDLYRLAEWLSECGIETVVMEATGVYWIPLFEILEARGLEVRLVNARHVKNVSGRKSDVLDCQWLQQLHTYGLLQGAFRPVEEICVLRAYLRQRGMLVKSAAAHIQHLQKALQQMNLLLHTVVSDITGVTGMKIMRAILAGERNPQVLAASRDQRCKQSAAVIAESLVGNYREEHLFALRQALELYEVYQAQIAACDREIERQLASFAPVVEGEPPAPKRGANAAKESERALRTHLYQMTGVDLTQLDGIQATTAVVLIAEIGCDMSRWPSAKHFASWLGLCPGTKVSGGKVLASRTKRVANRAATALRLAASSLYRSRSALGAYFRRLKARLGAPQAITAVAHKLARLVYSLLKHGTEYVDAGQDYYEQQYKARVMKNLKQRAKQLGYELVPTAP
jgi:transposase